VFLLKDKIDTFEKLIYFFAKAKNQFGLNVQHVCSVHQTKFMDKKAQNFFCGK